MEEAQRLVDSGEIDESSLVWTAGMGKEWLKLSSVLGNPPFASLDMGVRKPLPLVGLRRLLRERYPTSRGEARHVSILKVDIEGGACST